MPGSKTAELIFIAAMMLLILVISFAAVFFFMKTYRKEMAEKEARGDTAGRAGAGKEAADDDSA